MRRSRRLFQFALFLLLVPGSVMLWIPAFLVFVVAGWGYFKGQEPNPFGFALIVPGFVLFAWCVVDFVLQGKGTPSPLDPPKRLVVRGPYRRSRNPMYVGVLLVVIGEALLLRSKMMLNHAVCTAIAFHLWTVLHEEPYLLRAHGDAYREYCRRVRRWI
ncbi:hypothetical protein BH09SUM1_BH09SUM1_13480 [soil metagenome]